MAAVPRKARNRLASNTAQTPVLDKAGEEEENDEGDELGNQGQGKKTKEEIEKSTCKGGINKVCGIFIPDHENSVCCDLCEYWFHPKCQDLSIEAFRAIGKYSFLWLCAECKPNFMSALKLGRRVEARVAAAEETILNCLGNVRSELGTKLEQSVGKQIDDKLTNLEKKMVETINDQHVKAETKMQKQVEDKLADMEKKVVETINIQQNKVEVTLQEQKEAVQSVPRLTTEMKTELKKNVQELKEIVEKKEDKANREVNILLHNIPESRSSDVEVRKKYDADSFQNVVEALIGEGSNMEVEKIYRLGKRREPREGDDRPGQGQEQGQEQKPRLMLIKLKKKEDVDLLMRKRWELRNVGFENIYLTRDLSPAEREAQRKLREELIEKGKNTHKIFRGKVVPRT